jgi:uncharacterized protein YjbI with pentapeptide repeats
VVKYPGVTDTLSLDEVTTVHIRDHAFASISLEGGRKAGTFLFDRIVVTEGINFDGGQISGPIFFRDVHTFDVVKLSYCKFASSIQFEDCKIHADLDFQQSDIAKGVLFSSCRFAGDFSFSNVRVATGVLINGVNFEGNAELERGLYSGSLVVKHVSAMKAFRLDQVLVSSNLQIEESKFDSDLNLAEGLYRSAVRFAGVEVQGRTWLDRVKVCGAVNFQNCRFQGTTTLTGGGYEDSILFQRVTFSDDVNFDDVAARGYVEFSSVTFEKSATFARGDFVQDVRFRDVIFKGPVTFENARFAGAVEFERVIFENEVNLAAIAERVTLKRVSFTSQSALVIARAEITIKDSKFFGPTTVSALEGLEGCSVTDTPRVISLAGSDLTNLVFANVDLSRCYFRDGHNLDKLRIEQAIRTFSLSPAGLIFQFDWPPLLKWTKRAVIAEEVSMRIADKRVKFSQTWSRLTHTSNESGSSPADVARIYRQLRKGREDAKDEPGAADFYYGEMEMRRASAARRSAERFILWLYWISAGYGLRASRALGLLATVILTCGFISYHFGFTKHRQLIDSLLYLLDAVTKVGSVQLVDLTRPGQVIVLVLRLAAPVLLGLAVLSIRGRTKR